MKYARQDIRFLRQFDPKLWSSPAAGQQQLPGGTAVGERHPHPGRGGTHRPPGGIGHRQPPGGADRHPGQRAERGLSAEFRPGPAVQVSAKPAPCSCPWWKRGVSAPGTWSLRQWRRSTSGTAGGPGRHPGPGMHPLPAADGDHQRRHGGARSWWMPGGRPPAPPRPAPGAGRPGRRGMGGARFYVSERPADFQRLADTSCRNPAAPTPSRWTSRGTEG